MNGYKLTPVDSAGDPFVVVDSVTPNAPSVDVKPYC